MSTFASPYFSNNPPVYKNWIFKNKGNSVFEKVVDDSIQTKYEPLQNGTWFDANNDGLLDMLSSNTAQSFVSLNKGNNVFEKSSILDRASLQSLGIIDYEGDGLDDILMVTRDTNFNYAEHLTLYKNTGQGKFTKQESRFLDDVFYNKTTSIIPSNQYKYNINIIDFNNDGLLDIFLSKPVANQIVLSIKAMVSMRSCVWPGDTDSSGTVNHFDLLNIGLNFNTVGTPRTINQQNINWYGHFSDYWSKNNPSTNTNLNHIDTNGDGIINAADSLAINQNWEKIHSLVGDKPLETRSAIPPIFIETSPVVANKNYAFPIILGDATNTVDAVYGLGFSIRYDMDKIVPNSVYLTYENCWLGKDLLTISKNINTAGRIDVALVRKNKLNIEGRGQIATLHFTVKQGTTNGTNQMTFTVQNSKAIDNANRPLSLNERTATVMITATKEPEWASAVIVYPNPVNEKLHIESVGTETKRIEIYNYNGELQIDITEPNTAFDINMANLSPSFYMVKIQTDKGMIVRKVVKVK
jgi:Secretion system C-terminal sorting domain/FG-GAP-like repeat